VDQSLFLSPLDPGDLAFTTAPVLGAAGADFFTVTCELNLAAEVYVLAAGSDKRLASSPPGTAHRLKVPCDRTREGAFVLVAANGRALRKAPLRIPAAPTADKLTFVAIGDTQDGAHRYAALAEAAMNHQPHLVVRAGDVVHWGPNRWEWDGHLFDVARGSLTRVPHYAVPGNHDTRLGVTWMAEQLFYAPPGDGGLWNWSQRIGPVLLIGVNGAADWAAGSTNIQWLQRVLEDGAAAKFVFFVNHYPPISSGYHSSRKNGRYRERTSQEASEVILPLLARHRVTAYICGHEHFYERLESEQGVTVLVITGGVSMRPKTWDPPGSKVWANEHHYSLFEIEQDTCTLRTLTVEGKEIDRKTWPARVLDPSS